ncbi:nucleoid-associated protein [Quadrisphaera granulorum]|uniref:nucleoid-associated protein n=1 Tax=Quadrisphaera granulorum TaxID=317664 RepID=UPI0011B6E2E7|nr:nucleoid-associated protein [Quadrisphaera granulorum]
MALITLKINQLALHLIQRAGRSTRTEPVLSEALTPLDGQNRGFLQTRLSDALKRARPVVEDPELPAQAPAVVKQYLDGTTPLLETSTALAKLLQESQPGVSPAGLLMVADGSLDKEPILVIAKLEHETGARARQQTTPDGKQIYGMEFLQDLFFTKGSRVYKVAVFTAPPNDTDPLFGQVSDQQSAGSAVAGYFMNVFLGCNFTQRADVLTELFHNAALRYFDTVQDPARRAHYQVALLSELTSNRQEISVSAFARDHLDPQDQVPFTDAVGSESVHLTRPVPKDLTLIASKLARVQMDFESNVMLLAPPEEFGEEGTVSIDEAPEGRSTVTITDTVKRVTSAGRIRKTAGEADDES